MQARAPLAPHPDTLRNPNFTILDASGTQLLCWCPLHRCGAVYHNEVGIWNMQCPVSFAEFLTACKTHGYIVDQSDDLACWIEACTAADAPRPNAPGGNC